MSLFSAHSFHDLLTGHVLMTPAPRPTPKPPCVVHPLNVPLTPGQAPQDFTQYRLESLTIKTIATGKRGRNIRRPALVVQMILENTDSAGDGATYSLRTLASLEDLKRYNHPQAAEAVSKACHYYSSKIPTAQQEAPGAKKSPAQKGAREPALLALLHRLFA